MKRFAIGDIHGGYKALMQCLEKSKFNKEEDELIVLGDVVDGWPEVKEVVDELIKIKHIIPIKGNHDAWFMEWVNTGYAAPIWTSQGGKATLKSYTTFPDELEAYDKQKLSEHMDKYFNKCLPYYIDEDNNIFVHGGFNPKINIVDQDVIDLLWDRSLYTKAIDALLMHTEYKIKGYNNVFIGHTTTEYSHSWKYEGSTEPFIYGNLINLDTGGGWSGKLTIMNIDTKEYWQSDFVYELYPEAEGRG